MVVEESMVKQVAVVVETLKVTATKRMESKVSPGTISKSGGGKYHFLPKGMMSCCADTHHTYKA